ncbi:MAG: sugar ABC transporter substrate-binding protein [Verrucomicrobiota bacterium]
MQETSRNTILLASILSLGILSGCGKEKQETGETADGATILTAWAHHGKPEEWATIQDQVDRFNKSQNKIRIKLVEIAEGNYDTQVQSAAVTKKLPEILEFDGPMLANYVWKGYLKPLENVISTNLQQKLLPSIRKQGTYRDSLYAVGAFDSGLALYGNTGMLKAVNARIPGGIDDAWTVEEFDGILKRLAKKSSKEGKKGYALDIKRDYKGEWWTYGFYATLASAGAGLIDTREYTSAEDALNSGEAVEVMRWFKQWAQKGYIAPNTDGRAFTDKRVALSWVGHWEYPRYSDAIGNNLALIPLPDFGHGTKTGMGSWCWGITRNCKNTEAAAEFIEFLLSDKEILNIVRANGAVPGTTTAVEKSDLYKPGAPLHLFAEQLRKCAVPRPRTPAYPVITSAFQKALLDILDGANVKRQLDQAVRIIDADIEENDGYPMSSETVK